MIELKFDQKDLDKLKDKLEAISPKNRLGVTRKGFVDATLAIENKLSDNVNNRILHIRSSRLFQSIGSKVTDDEGLIGEIGSGVRQGDRVPYANIHETGGVIKPKNGKYLWIPVRSGSSYAMNFVGDRAAGGMSLGQAGFKVKDGKIIGKSYSKKVLMWIPVKQVTIPARRYMSITVEQMNEKVDEIMSARIEKEAEKS